MLGLSVDSVVDHHKWMKDIEETAKCSLRFPIVDDKDRNISMKYGMLDKSNVRGGAHTGMTLTVRSVFMIGPEKRIELILTYPVRIGRNFNEILRCFDALKLSREQNAATPADWQPGQPFVVLPFISTDQAKLMYNNVKEVKPYLRFATSKEQ